MNDTPPSTPLTSYALSRLRRLAEGNGLSADKIELVETLEKVYAIEGVTQLTPFCEFHPAQYQGPPRKKDRTILPNFVALQNEARQRQQDFYGKREWLPAALEELKTAPGEGWGLDGAKITLPGKSAILAASETCSACQGRKMFTCTQCQGLGSVVCTYCQGRGLEVCYNCAGRGDSPTHPGQPCNICQGKRYIPCRFCRSSGKLVCPTCQGKRGTTCPQCAGSGVMTQEIALACGAEIHFSIKGESWPVGVRRGLDRLGIINLPQGHADISRLPEQPPKNDDETAADEDAQARPRAKPTPSATVRYRADLPYADLKLRFGDGRVALVSAFGKRGLMMGVPPFLDEALQPWRDKLKQAALGKLPFEKALEARAMRDAFTLVIGGQGKPENLRKIYPLGLSPQATQDILQDMRRALDRFTLHVRIGTAAAAGVIGTALLAAFTLMPLHVRLMQTLPALEGLTLDLAALVFVMEMSWIALGKSVQFKLKRKFPGLKISLHKNAGFIGQIMLAGIGGAWAMILALLPIKPAWVLYVLWMASR